MLHADSARNRMLGIGCASLAYLMFTFIDGSAKWLVQFMPVMMVVWLRFTSQVIVVSVLVLPVKGMALVRTRHLKWHLVRSVMFMLMTGMNFWALQYLQLTVVASIFFTVPIIIALLGAPLLGEKLDARRWAAVLLGFVGVLVIVQPGSEAFHPAVILSVGNAILYAIFILMTRWLAAYDSPETIQFLPAVGAMIGMAPFALAAWEWPSGWLEWTLACLLGVFGGTGHYLLALANRYAPASVVAPFLYQQVLYLAAFGYVVFGDVPPASLWLGAAIVIASGLYLFARERGLLR